VSVKIDAEKFVKLHEIMVSPLIRSL